MTSPTGMQLSHPARGDICQRHILDPRPAAPYRTETHMNDASARDIDDRVRALNEELRLADSISLANVPKVVLILNQERLRGGLADSLRLIDELRRRIDELENRQ